MREDHRGCPARLRGHPFPPPERRRPEGSPVAGRRTARDDGRGYELLALAVAGWIRFLRCCDGAGRPLPVEDPRADLVELARESGDDLRPFLRQHDVFGDLGTDDVFTATVTGHLAALEESGPHEAVARCLDDTVRSLR